jgi:hypothetical protein
MEVIMRNAVDFKFYDYQTEDRRAHRDPRPIEDLEQAINPGFDEDGDIQSDPLPPHIPRMTQLDRQIYESCAISGAKVLWPHQNTSIPRHLTIPYIMSRAKCSEQEASEIADEAALLDATPAMVDEFCRWARVRGASKLIDYLYPMALTVVEVEAEDQEEPPWFYNPSTAGEKLPGVFGEAGICEDIERDINPDYLDSSWQPPEKAEAPAQTLGYHVLEDFGAVEQVPWINRQPKVFVKLVERIQKAANLDALGKIGKEIYKRSSWNRNQISVLWTEYNSRKSNLERMIPLTSTTRALVARIAKANGNLSSLGIFLHKVQAGEVKVHPVPQQREWTIIWRKYRETMDVELTAQIDNLKTERDALKRELKALVK